ncbi:PrpF domain-containing protein [Streptomyces viridosporus]|uniref:PrpF domain-containing protein n=1 Tax=Streptomyces viridosporus TaxID=67581 RepID=UPI0002FF8E35|nr:PrpF domain-containing protein [Streptomyces viridosporus]
MTGHLAYAMGSPCPTLVLDAGRLPRDEAALLAHLARARGQLVSAGGANVLKIALIEPSAHPMFDLDYRFVQTLPGVPDRFDLHGSCGHSILSAVLAASRSGMLPRLVPKARIRVRVLNNGDGVVCEVDRVERDGAGFTITFVQQPPAPFGDLLPDGRTRTVLRTGGDRTEVSLVSGANAYAFVDARRLGVPDQEALFTAGDELLGRLESLRGAAADRLGRPRGGAFPKIAAVLPAAEEGIAARAVTVPGWHPSIALTGLVCLGTAVRIPGTVPWRIARENGTGAGRVEVVTPGGRTAVTAVTSVSGTAGGGGALLWATVARKDVTYQGSIALTSLNNLRFEEVAPCLALSEAA